jgi:hypothetical protein
VAEKRKKKRIKGGRMENGLNMFECFHVEQMK